MLNAEQIREQMGKIRARTQNPINLNFFCHTPPVPQQCARGAMARAACSPIIASSQSIRRRPIPSSNRTAFDAAMCEVVEETKPEVVSFHFGLPEPSLLDRLKAAGFLVMSSATTVAEARWLEEHGVDAVIAQGFEAGGHRGIFLTEDHRDWLQVGTFALVPQVVDAVKVPVIAAGGITDARGIAAAFALGAAGVQIGTAYLWCPEAKISAPHRAALKSAARRRHGRDQSDDRPSGARHRQPAHARDRAHVGRGARISARRRARSRRCAPRRRRRARAISRPCGRGRRLRSAAHCRPAS